MENKRICVQPLKDVKDIQKVNSYLKEHNYKAYVLWQTGINTGLRISDILRLKVFDVYNQKYINIIEKKTGKYKRFPIVQNLQTLLNDYCEGRDFNEPLFTASLSNNKLNRKSAWRYIVDACKKAGITEHVGTHTMRKTFGYHHYQQFHDAVILQKIFNHSSQRITLIYIGVEQDEIDASYFNFAYNFEKNVSGERPKKRKIVEIPVIKTEYKTKEKIVKVPVVKEKVVTKIVKEKPDKQIKDILKLLENVSSAETKNSKFARFLIDYIKNPEEEYV